MSKFNDAIDEWLYQQCADEEEGSSSEGAGYYAQYRAPLMSNSKMNSKPSRLRFRARSKRERFCSSVPTALWKSRTTTTAEFESAWEEIACAQVEPSEDDYTTEDLHKFSQSRKLVLTVADGQDWRQAVRAHMDAEQYWPNVWSISDHGNIKHLSLEAK